MPEIIDVRLLLVGLLVRLLTIQQVHPHAGTGILVTSVPEHVHVPESVAHVYCNW